MVRYFLNSLAGRAIIVGIALRLAIAAIGALAGHVPQFLGIVDSVAGLAIAAGIGYFVFRLLVLAKRRLLWRVRRKLILSYVFVGFVPALLIVAFFLLCGYLVFYNISSYLVASRLHALGDQARLLARTTAIEIQRAGGVDAQGIVARRQSREAVTYPDLSVAVVPVARACDTAPPAAAVRLSEGGLVAGPWKHVDAPQTLPAWLPCDASSSLLAFSHAKNAAGGVEDTHLLVRAVAFPEGRRPTFGVVVDILVNDSFRQQLRNETGVEIRNVYAAPGTSDKDPTPLRGRAGGDERAAPPPEATGLMRYIPPSVIEYRDWSTGASSTLAVSMVPSIGELWDRLSGAGGKGGLLSRTLLLLLIVIAALFLIIESVAAFAGFTLAKSITGSVHELFMGTERVRQGDFTHKIAIRSDDQLGELAGSFNQMTASIEDLLLQAAEKKRLEEELRIAHEIQMSLLPQGPLVMAGLSVTAVCVPAREVGGDYYDFLLLDDHRVGVLIADVSGKGTSAALYMAELKGLMLSLSRIHTSPRDLLIDANRIIAEHLDARSFITMTYAVVDLRTRTMTYARAGHTPLIHVPGPGPGGEAARRARILAPDGLVLGLKIDRGEMFERLLQEDTIRLHEGDLYLFFTDGISEAMNARDDCFGEGRLGQLVETHAHLRPDELRERVLREIAAFVGDAPQHDDMTMILLKVEGQRAEGRRQKAEDVGSVVTSDC